MTATPAQMTKAVEAYVSSYCKGDLDGIVSIFDKWATVEDPVGAPILKGHDAIREFMSVGVSMGAKLRLLGSVRCAADKAAFPFAVDLKIDGVANTIEVIDVFRFNEAGKVVEMRAIWGPENMASA
jgi:steroid delta-isomerase